MFCTMRGNWKTSVVDFRVNINKGLVSFRNFQSPAITQSLRPVHSLNLFSKSSNAFLRMHSNGWRNWTAVIKNTSTEQELDGKMIRNVVYYNFRKTVSIEYVREDVIDNALFDVILVGWSILGCRQWLDNAVKNSCIEVESLVTSKLKSPNNTQSPFFLIWSNVTLSSSLNSCKLLFGGL